MKTNVKTRIALYACRMLYPGIGLLWAFREKQSGSESSSGFSHCRGRGVGGD